MRAPFRAALRRSRSIGGLLLISFGLTVASFAVALAVLAAQSRGISRAARAIASSDAPSVDHLSRMRSIVRHGEVLLDDLTDRAAAGGALSPSAEREIQGRLRSLRDEWNVYTTLPVYPGEPERWVSLVPSLSEVDHAVARVCDRLRAGDGEAAEVILEREAKPAIDRLDLELDKLMRFKSVESATRGREILSIQRSLRPLSLLLYLCCAGLAALGAFAAVRVVRRQSDIMERRVSELQQFAGRVAHDIRSPLTSVGLALDVAQREAQIEPRVQAILARGSRTLARVGQVVDGLLVFAGAGAAPTTSSVAELRPTVNGVIEDLAPAALEKSVELKVARADVAVVACSAGVLTSILSNLIGNAIKYMGDTPIRKVTVSACRARGWARIEIRDTGPGIPRDMQARVFDPHVRAAQAAIPGLGLGLATVRRLVEAHGGAVELSSYEGEGSLFSVDLPLAPEDAPAAAPSSPGGASVS
jgi:signal transduction histidine kinase